MFVQNRMWVMKKLIQVGVGGVLLLVDDDNDDERVSLSLSVCVFCCQMNYYCRVFWPSFNGSEVGWDIRS